MEIDFVDLYRACEDERIRRWLYNQLPEYARLSGTLEGFRVDSVRIRFDPDVEYEE